MHLQGIRGINFLILKLIRRLYCIEDVKPGNKILHTVCFRRGQLNQVSQGEENNKHEKKYLANMFCNFLCLLSCVKWALHGVLQLWETYDLVILKFQAFIKALSCVFRICYGAPSPAITLRRIVSNIKLWEENAYNLRTLVLCSCTEVYTCWNKIKITEYREYWTTFKLSD